MAVTAEGASVISFSLFIQLTYLATKLVFLSDSQNCFFLVVTLNFIIELFFQMMFL